MVRKVITPVLCGLFAFTIAFAIVIGCSEDLVLEDLPSLLGNYEGRYIYITNYGSATGRQTNTYLVTWRFSDLGYWVWNDADTTISDDGDICEPSGDYILADGVEMIEKEEGCAGVISDNEKNPSGIFQLRQPGDTIIMTQLQGDIYREIILWPAQD